MNTEAINHDLCRHLLPDRLAVGGPAEHGRPGPPHGLGTMNEDLPTFIVMVSRGHTDQPLYDRLWGSGCLPSRYQGVKDA